MSLFRVALLLISLKPFLFENRFNRRPHMYRIRSQPSKMSPPQPGEGAEPPPWPRFALVSFDDTEDLERYELGGFHPVHLGDVYDGGRYRVVHKLGAGSFSTVWLAQDETEHRWVALKFVVADSSVGLCQEPIELPYCLTVHQ